jgi:hypothetical protein
LEHYNTHRHSPKETIKSESRADCTTRWVAEFAIDKAGGSFDEEGVGEGGGGKCANTRNAVGKKREGGFAQKRCHQAVETKKPHSDRLKTSARHPNKA